MIVNYSSKKEDENGKIGVTIVSSMEIRNLDFIPGIIGSHIAF